MHPRRLVSAALTFALLFCAFINASARGQQLGNVTVSGPVNIDGLPVAGTGSIAYSARISTGTGGTATITLASGGEVLVSEQTDIVVSLAGAGVKVQLICGRVETTSTAKATMLSVSGASVTVMKGSAEITKQGDAKTSTLKAVKDTNVEESVMAVFDGGSGVLMKSRIQCDCNCN